MFTLTTKERNSRLNLLTASVGLSLNYKHLSFMITVLFFAFVHKITTYMILVFPFIFIQRLQLKTRLLD